jgi:hypothetical protein
MGTWDNVQDRGVWNCDFDYHLRDCHGGGVHRLQWLRFIFRIGHNRRGTEVVGPRIRPLGYAGFRIWYGPLYCKPHCALSTPRILAPGFAGISMRLLGFAAGAGQYDPQWDCTTQHVGDWRGHCSLWSIVGPSDCTGWIPVCWLCHMQGRIIQISDNAERASQDIIT